jgi:hypothetical protein
VPGVDTTGTKSSDPNTCTTGIDVPMNLIEALEIAKTPAGENSPSLRIFLACGFVPLIVQK